MAKQGIATFEDPEAFLGFGGDPMLPPTPSSSTADRAAAMIRQMESGLPTGRPFSALVSDRDNLRVTRNPYEILEDRQRQAGDLATGMGLGLTSDLLGLPADALALIFRDAPKFAASLVSGQSFADMPQGTVDQGFTVLQDLLGSDAIAGYLGVSEEELRRPGVESGRLLSSIVDPIAIGGALRAFVRGKGAAGPRSTDALADAAAGDAAARAGDADVLDVRLPRAANVDEVIEPAFRQGIGYQNMIRDPDLAGMTDDQLVARYNDEVDTFNTTFFSTADGVDRDAAQIQFDRATMNIQNELMGRRGGELTILGLDGVAALRVANEQATAAARRGESGEGILSLGEADGLPDLEELPTFLVQPDKQEIATRFFSGDFSGSPGGVGALDKNNPVFAQNALKIGGSDEFLGRVKHYSPALTSLMNIVQSGKFARAADASGKVSGEQIVSMLKGEPAVLGEIKDSQFEAALLKDPNAKFDEAEIRRLMTTRLPQTRTRFYDLGEYADELNAGTAPLPPNGPGGYAGMQTSREISDLVDGQTDLDYGVMIMANTAQSIDVPGFGRIKTKGIEGHDYYSSHPGYYFHVRTAEVVEGAIPDGTTNIPNSNKYLVYLEGQGNAVSNESSGSRIGGQYYRTLDERLDAWRQGYEAGGDRSVRIPYTPEVDKLLRQRDDLRPAYLKEVEAGQAEYDRVREILKNSEEQLTSDAYPAYTSNEFAGGFYGRKIRGGAALGKALSGLTGKGGNLARSTIRRNFLKLFESGRPDGANPFIEPIRYFQDLDSAQSRTAISDMLTSSGAPSSPEIIDTIVQDLELVRKKHDLFADQIAPGVGDDYGVQSRLVIDEYPELVVDNTRLDSRYTIDSTKFRQLPLEERAAIALAEYVASEAERIYRTKAKALLFSSDSFIKALQDLTPNEVNVLQSEVSSAQARIDLKQRLTDSFSDADLAELNSNIAEIYDDVGKMYDAEGFEMQIPTTPDMLSRDIFTQGVPEKYFGNRTDFETTFSMYFDGEDIDNILTHARMEKEREKVDALFVELAKRRESPKYGEALEEFRTAVDTHPDAEKMETLYQVAKRTFSSNGQNGFIAPLPYSNEADAYAASVRFLAKEALDAGYKGVIIPDAARLANQRGFNGGGSTASNFNKFKSMYGNAIDKGLKAFKTANPDAAIEMRNTSPSNQFLIQSSDGSLIPLEGTADKFDPNAGAVVNRSVPLRVIELKNRATKDLLRGPIRRAKGGPVDLRPKKLVHSGIGAMARQVM